ncbi:hypothetical protein M9Y10_024104 [Tritrichomonas musculus]|uniref:Uncharacterized protein n=1 Tax=Tritrichomonas musculus TaxID=1915356 RepID=A0ABR2KWY7_9EUKA
MNLYKTNENPELIRNISLEPKNVHGETLQYIIKNFSNFENLPSFNEILNLGSKLISFVDDAQADDFNILFINDFFQQLITFVRNGSKPIVYGYCVDALNLILENSEAEEYIQPFLEPSFAYFVLIAATYIDSNEQSPISPIIYSSQKLIYSKLLQVLLNIFRKKIDIFYKFKPSFIFQRICDLYQRDINLSASNKALEFLFCLLSQKDLILIIEHLKPIFEMVSKYFNFLFKYTQQKIQLSLDAFPITLPPMNCNACSAKFDDFSKMCQLMIKLAQKDLDHFYQSVSIYNLFSLISFSNQICSCSLIDLLIYILSLPNVPVEFPNSIIWEKVDQAIEYFNAIRSNDSDFIIKICDLIEALIPYKGIQPAQLNDLIQIIKNGSYRMQQKALCTICNLFLKYPDQLFQLKFQAHLNDCVLFAIFDSFESAEDQSFIKLLLHTLLKIIEYFQSKKIKEPVLAIQEFCTDEYFFNIFDKQNYEEIKPYQNIILEALNANPC